MLPFASRAVSRCLAAVWLAGSALAFAAADGQSIVGNPSTLGDLVHIQDTLRKNIPAAMACVVCLKAEDSSGSGVVVDSAGTIYTAAHVVVDDEGKEQDMEAVFPDGRKGKIRLVLLDRANDAAIVRLADAMDIKAYARLAGKEPVAGEWVFSIGHGNGLDVKRGAMVRLGRVIALRDGCYKTDCKLIGGDSGGPLFNMKGELIGIHSRVGGDIEANLHVPFPVYKAMLRGK